jgi:hypothetical protein
MAYGFKSGGRKKGTLNKRKSVAAFLREKLSEQMQAGAEITATMPLGVLLAIVRDPPTRLSTVSQLLKLQCLIVIRKCLGRRS